MQSLHSTALRNKHLINLSLGLMVVSELVACAPTLTPPHFQDSDMATILLPPKSFLLMPWPLFLQQQDTIVDVFNQVLFWKNVHRVYSHPLAQPDSPWAVYFAVIILLVLGQDQQILTTSDPVMQSQLVGPLITAPGARQPVLSY